MRFSTTVIGTRLSTDGLVEDRSEQLLADVVRAAARHEAAARREQAHGVQVDVLVAGDGVRNRRLVLGEGGRVEHDRVVAFAGTLQPAQLVEDVGLAGTERGRPLRAALAVMWATASAEMSTPRPNRTVARAGARTRRDS
jgi:hypothetical protein